MEVGGVIFFCDLFLYGLGLSYVGWVGITLVGLVLCWLHWYYVGISLVALALDI